MSASKITIIVPVYGDWPSLQDCLELLKKHVDKKHTILIVNDCGPEADLLEKKIRGATRGIKKFKYFRNDANLGFIKTCNRAVNELDKTDNDILLLNSDTKVTAGFLEEMAGVLYSAGNIGVVSPRSNNATICTIPLSAINQKGISADKSYELFKKYSAKFPRRHKVPTGHGFCMLIRRTLIKKYGLFDSVFGRGYGEEVDFCQRIGRQGWASVLANHTYVFHLEAKSFSLETKAQLLKDHNKIIRNRYPGYKQSVTNYINRALAEEKKIMGKDAIESSGSKLTNLKQRLRQLLKSN
ncbi:MAG TPA: glycosyltransferase family 2 protein [Candidatus Saccharimonadales bacterium]|nr:glycosyltransferase family 2 protein [Candidatus Saccharimonadales bacterium]